MGLQVEAEPIGTFYVWANLSHLPPSLQDGFDFFEAGLNEKVITVPGVFFDVNPEKRRVSARFRNYSRISFGPEMSAVERGLNGLERGIRSHSWYFWYGQEDSGVAHHQPGYRVARKFGVRGILATSRGAGGGITGVVATDGKW